MNFKYRVSILNENTLEEPWHVRLSRLSVFLLVSALVFVTFIILTLLILYTPIRYYLPGYGDSGNRSLIMKEAARADSLDNQLAIQANYLEVLKGVIGGELSADSIPSVDSVEQVQQTVELLEKSKNEELFLKDFEESDKFSVSDTDVKTKTEMYVFFRPVSGTISADYNPQKNQNGIYFTTQSASVLSVLAGTIISTENTFNSGCVVVVQHENNFISVYKNTSLALKKTGSHVKAGEAIASIKTDKPSKLEDLFFFELWKDGQSVDPKEYIIF